jgi:hypothetical protein
VFLAGNALWAVWGWHDHAWALLLLQAALSAMNLRGARKADAQAAQNEPAPNSST